ncbi:carbohydrate esterase family 8 protein [Sphaerosporella brunnea]|uniref:Pectinesterase n=1 Tax=Sphaerosporella brunnea TaxID=1250544 RepID=A0A5J5EKD5_9PEZI|nr:carbohydrate esterase family 8 protein [Sphaerosporella brunnea]
MIFKLHSVLIGLVALLSLAEAGVIRKRTTSRTSSPSGCVVVSKSATSGQYSTVQDAVDSLSTTASGTQCIFIYQGTYNEQVYIAARTAQLTIYGYTTDTSSYSKNTVTITQGLSQDDVSTDDLTATLRAWNVGLKVYNINLENTRGKGSQALAVSASAGQQGYYGVKFIGYQDTILAETGYQVYAKCYIEGAVDFIFGQYARAWFYDAVIRIQGAGSITANGRDSNDNVSYYVITDSDIKVADGVTLAKGSAYLGRPWRDYARVVFQNTAMTDIINSAGWSVWSSSDANTEYVTFGEYDNSGAGSQGTRASFAKTLSAPVTITTILGSDYANWVDTDYLS